VVLKKGQKGGDGRRGEKMWDYRVLGPLCVLGCRSIVLMEGAWVRDRRRMKVCMVSTVG
jgi:hypothetical protein